MFLVVITWPDYDFRDHDPIGLHGIQVSNSELKITVSCRVPPHNQTSYKLGWLGEFAAIKKLQRSVFCVFTNAISSGHLSQQILYQRFIGLVKVLSLERVDFKKYYSKLLNMIRYKIDCCLHWVLFIQYDCCRIWHCILGTRKQISNCFSKSKFKSHHL